MDNQNLIYLIIALIMIFVGVYLFSKSFLSKKDSAAPLTNETGKNIVPRDQRSNLIVDQSTKNTGELGNINPSESKLPVAETAAANLSPSEATTFVSHEQSDVAASQTPVHSQLTDTEKTNVDQLGDTLSSLEHATADIMPVIDSGKADEFEGSSNLLDAHLQEQEMQDQNSALKHAAEVVSLTLLPNQVLNFDGDAVLQILDAYGLKFGEMNLFHRYEEADGSGPLLFSVMRYAEKEGTQPFDLQTLSDETVDGLTFFLPLPHPKAAAGIGAMLSMSGSMARDLNATIYDEQFELLDRKGRESLREYVTDYKMV